jgi:hypothetical protein
VAKSCENRVFAGTEPFVSVGKLLVLNVEMFGMQENAIMKGQLPSRFGQLQIKWLNAQVARLQLTRIVDAIT